MGLHGLVDSSHPAGHLTGTVNVVRLHVLGESVLGRGNHGLGRYARSCDRIWENPALSTYSNVHV